jgi:predicted alpha/beta hydrolase family esterase
MKQAIILHGKPTKEGYYSSSRERNSQSNSHWLPWLQHELILRDILAQTPELPKPYEPKYEDWKRIFEQLQPDKDTLLVGHSCGGGFLLRWLSENKHIKVGKVMLVAPSLGQDWEDTTGFMNFKIDPDFINRTDGVTIFYSDDDKPGIGEAVSRITELIPKAKLITFHGRGHFTEKSNLIIEFPELLEECIK